MITFIMYNYVKLNKFISKIPFPQFWFRNQKKPKSKMFTLGYFHGNEIVKKKF